MNFTEGKKAPNPHMRMHTQHWNQTERKCFIRSRNTPIDRPKLSIPEWCYASERKTRIQVEMTRSLLSKSNIPHKFWGGSFSLVSFPQNLTNQLNTSYGLTRNQIQDILEYLAEELTPILKNSKEIPH